MERLTARKAEIRNRHREIEVPQRTIEEVSRVVKAKQEAKRETSIALEAPAAEEPEDTMSRLLAAKQQVSGKERRDH